MGDFYRELGRRIAELRRRCGLTQERFAERASITTSYLARIETGTRKPTLDVMRRLAGELGVPVWRLLADEQTRGEPSMGGETEKLVAASRNLPREDLDLLTQLARRLDRADRAPPATRASRAAESAPAKRRKR